MIFIPEFVFDICYWVWSAKNPIALIFLLLFCAICFFVTVFLIVVFFFKHQGKNSGKPKNTQIHRRGRGNTEAIRLGILRTRILMDKLGKQKPVAPASLKSATLGSEQGTPKTAAQ